MARQKVVSARLPWEAHVFLRRNGLSLSEQLRLDLELVRALEALETGRQAAPILVRDVRFFLGQTLPGPR